MEPITNHFDVSRPAAAASAMPPPTASITAATTNAALHPDGQISVAIESRQPGLTKLPTELAFDWLIRLLPAEVRSVGQTCRTLQAHAQGLWNTVALRSFQTDLQSWVADCLPRADTVRRSQTLTRNARRLLQYGPKDASEALTSWFCNLSSEERRRVMPDMANLMSRLNPQLQARVVNKVLDNRDVALSQAIIAFCPALPFMGALQSQLVNAAINLFRFQRSLAIPVYRVLIEEFKSLTRAQRHRIFNDVLECEFPEDKCHNVGELLAQAHLLEQDEVAHLIQIVGELSPLYARKVFEVLDGRFFSLRHPEKKNLISIALNFSTESEAAYTFHSLGPALEHLDQDDVYDIVETALTIQSVDRRAWGAAGLARGAPYVSDDHRNLLFNASFESFDEPNIAESLTSWASHMEWLTGSQRDLMLAKASASSHDVKGHITAAMTAGARYMAPALLQTTAALPPRVRSWPICAFASVLADLEPNQINELVQMVLGPEGDTLNESSRAECVAALSEHLDQLSTTHAAGLLALAQNFKKSKNRQVALAGAVAGLDRLNLRGWADLQIARSAPSKLSITPL
ncbi:hypothetical protein SAMN05216359_102470 [Roseateles sp. YR242]|uniref:hypothetical protein n=1 Tax=Roseateles sp. YR242 TaxID=1855305 RepID=UPI0008CBEB50|nr:hypothetical protein [Roseateles sp. YR242]SEK63130.1 hypothetical protein SAMN05216359_102470 [Roseateles sp. YR242]